MAYGAKREVRLPKRTLIVLTLAGLVGCHSIEQPSGECALQNIAVASTDPLRNETYAATSAIFEIVFQNENAPTPADVFPDPRVQVKNRKTGEHCDITDGNGIWSGKSVYLDSSARVLLLNEYSGANDTLVFFDPRTCKRLGELDVSHKRWKVLSDRVLMGQQCRDGDVHSCRLVEESILDGRCMAKTGKIVARP